MVVVEKSSQETGTGRGSLPNPALGDDEVSTFKPRRFSIYLLAMLVCLWSSASAWTQGLDEGTGASRTIDAPSTPSAAPVTPAASPAAPASEGQQDPAVPTPGTPPAPERGQATVEGGTLAPAPATPNPLPSNLQRSALMLKNADQINLLNALAASEISLWPSVLKKNRSVVNKEFIEVVGLRSLDALNQAFQQTKIKGTREKVMGLVDVSFRYALLADMASKEIGLPGTHRMALAKKYYELRLYDMALSICRNVLVNEPKHLEAHQMAADICLTTGDLFGALTDYEVVVKLDPRNDMAYANIGFINMAMSNFPKAREALKKSLDINPSNPRAQQLLNRLDNPQQILPPSAQEVDPSMPPSVASTATGLVEQGRQAMLAGKLKDAETLFNQAVQIDPKSADAQMALGDLYFRQSEFYKAVDAYKEASTFAPDNPEPLYYMGMSCELIHDRTGNAQYLDSAIDCFRRAVQIRSDYTQAKDALQRVLEKKVNG